MPAQRALQVADGDVRGAQLLGDLGEWVIVWVTLQRRADRAGQHDVADRRQHDLRLDSWRRYRAWRRYAAWRRRGRSGGEYGWSWARCWRADPHRGAWL